MRNQGQLIFGAAVIIVGLMILVGNLFDINLWGICWPTGLILLGLWLLLRPRVSRSGAEVSMLPIGNVRRDESWEVKDEEFWLFVGDIDLDLRMAEIPLGETTLRTFGFVGDVELLVPAEVGVYVSTTAFVCTVRAFGNKVDNFLFPHQMTSDNYETAERKVRLETTCFVGEVKVKQA